MKKHFLIPTLLCLITLSLTGCGNKTSEIKPESIITVSAKSLSELAIATRQVKYPGIVTVDNEAKIIAKANGNITFSDIKVGDKINAGQSLGKIDEKGVVATADFNSAQIKQAQILVEQSLASYRLAQSNYSNLLSSSRNDLKQAEIMRDQATVGKNNLNITTDDSYKSALLAYETAKIATEQAKINLENKKNQITQGSQDTQSNALNIAQAVANDCNSLIANINNLIDFDNNLGTSYRNALGISEPGSYSRAQESYDKAKQSYNNYLKQTYSDTLSNVKAVFSLTQEVKKMVDSTKYLLEKSVSGSSLSQEDLINYQKTVSGYQSQINSDITQISGAEQALENKNLGNQDLADNLQKAYELAKKQEESARQSVESLKSGNISQKDQAKFNEDSAQNQYGATKIKIDSQITATKLQLDSARLQYENALVNLQNLYDNHSIISPIDGILTQKAISNGDSISPGQLIAVVSQLDNIKIQFYVEQESLSSISLGMSATVSDTMGNNYQGTIFSISPQADNLTRRFLVEIKLEEGKDLVSGTVVDVALNLTINTEQKEDIILPLSTIEIGQNGNNVFVIENDLAKKIPVSIVKVIGELAEVKIEAPKETKIIIEGNKLISEGQKVRLSQ
ncbi:MAG: efflux RND transporter periplasmic adaptor subunit [Planctomycetes bacterium]|nr:efflux RND transporter periplasmic adaptor subunit [Planctomycetota bacterium]